MNDRLFRTVARLGAVTLGAVATLFMAGSTGAIAVTDATDTVSDVHIETACGTYDDMSAFLYFHVDAGESTPADGRVTEVAGFFAGMASPDDRTTFTDGPPGGVAYFATGDYTIDLSYYMLMSILDGDTMDASLLLGNGAVAGHDVATVNCFNGTDATTVQNFEITARAGVPRAFRLLEHVTFPGLGADGVGQSWVASPGKVWNADGRDGDALDDLVLDPATSAELGASLSDSVLTIDATTAGDYTLEWGVVTSPDFYDADWTGLSGDRWGPATITVHVIDAPIQPSDSQIVDGAQGGVQVPASVAAGTSTTLSLGEDTAGGYVDVWLHSDPVYLGLFKVAADGTVGLTVPASMAAGDHKVIVTDEIGEFMGWNNLGVTAASAAGNVVPRAATGLDEQRETPWPMLALFALLPAGLVVRAARRS